RLEMTLKLLSSFMSKLFPSLQTTPPASYSSLSTLSSLRPVQPAVRSASITFVISSKVAGLEASFSHPTSMNKDNKSIRPLLPSPFPFPLVLLANSYHAVAPIAVHLIIRQADVCALMQLKVQRRE